MRTFDQNKKELKEIARNSFLYRALPQQLPQFEKEVDMLVYNPGAERFVDYMINMFNEGERQIMALAMVIQETLWS